MNTTQPNNVLICGVGGQGVLLLSDSLAHAALVSGFDVKKSEVHGMAQRGGSVVSHVRCGTRIFSPLIEEGTAQFLVALEQLESLRYLHYLAPQGVVLVDPLQLYPMPVLLGTADYPTDIVATLQRRAAKVYVVEAFRLAQELGQTRVQNTVMLGALSTLLSITPEAFAEAIRANVKSKFVDLNLKAFEEGRRAVSS